MDFIKYIKDNEGKNIKVSLVSKIEYLTVKYYIAKYKVAINDYGDLTIKNSKNVFTISKNASKCSIEDNVIYIETESCRINIILD